jgi:hypothetical protein
MCLLLVAPICWHYRNRNIGAMLLVAWVLAMNIQNVVNPIIWANDDLADWYNGAILCDIEVKIQTASSVAAPAALACVLRSLANAMDTTHVSLSKTKSQRWRGYGIDIAFCVGFPALQMLFHWIVQSRRYALIGITGCEAQSATSWLTIMLLDIVPLLWTFLDAFYSGQSKISDACFAMLISIRSHSGPPMPIPRDLRRNTGAQQYNEEPIPPSLHILHRRHCCVPAVSSVRAVRECRARCGAFQLDYYPQ